MLTSLPAAVSVTLLSLFPVMNPIGNLPAFFALTTNDTRAYRNRQATRTGLYVLALLALFALVGRPLLHALGISLPALQVAGGLIVGHAAYGMVTGTPGHLTAAEHAAAVDAEDVSFSPMAMPLVAGPGSIGIVIALASRSTGAAPIAGILIGVAIMAVLVLVTLRFGAPLLARLGTNGTAALTRVFGFLILAIAVELLTHGILTLAPGLTH